MPSSTTITLRPSTGNGARAPREFGAFARDGRGERRRAHRQRANDVVVHMKHAAARDGAHGKFRLVRHTELAHHQHVERCMQRLRNLAGNRHAAARQREHEQIRLARIRMQRGAQLAAGIGAIAKQRVHRLPSSCARGTRHGTRHGAANARASAAINASVCAAGNASMPAAPARPLPPKPRHSASAPRGAASGARTLAT
jgi:hypothetical protein